MHIRVLDSDFNDRLSELFSGEYILSMNEVLYYLLLRSVVSYKDHLVINDFFE